MPHLATASVPSFGGGIGVGSWRRGWLAASRGIFGAAAARRIVIGGVTAAPAAAARLAAAAA
jgi:hypothetical protein